MNSVHSEDSLEGGPAAARTTRHFSSPSVDGGSIPFFADAQLDLDEAHDIADTPEATRPQFDHHRLTLDRSLQLPSLRSAGGERDLEEDLQHHAPPRHLLLVSGGGGGVEKESPTASMALRNSNHHHGGGTATTTTNGENNNGNGEKRNFSQITASLEISTQQPKRKPRFPRDIAWLVAFLAFVPVTLLTTAIQPATGPLAQHPLSFATIHALTWTALATLLLSRALYQTAAAGEGDDTRQSIATLLVWTARGAPLVYFVLFVTLWSSGMHWHSLLFLLCAVRSVAVLRRGFNAKMAFTSAHICMALDILSRSLRRASFLRALMAVLTLQACLMILWRRALLCATSGGSSTAPLVTLCVLVAGQWAMWTVQKVLAYLAATGVLDWCAQQLTLLTTIPEEEDGEFESDDDDHNDDNYGDLPEAYSTVNASVYQSVLVTEDELLEDDYDDELDREVQQQQPDRSGSRHVHPPQPHHGLPTQLHRATVKSTLFSAFTISLGSIAHAGLLGSLSHFLWTHKLFLNFATAHSDIGLAHTAVYYKPHGRGSRDVLAILASSGMEAIVREDISQSLCNYVTSTLTCCIVLVTTLLLLHQRKTHPGEFISHARVFQDTLFSFLLSFNLISTVTEPLTAAIKASYVAFAQSPRCLSQAYPLIYHRLNRLSGARRR